MKGVPVERFKIRHASIALFAIQYLLEGMLFQLLVFWLVEYPLTRSFVYIVNRYGSLAGEAIMHHVVTAILVFVYAWAVVIRSATLARFFGRLLTFASGVVLSRALSLLSEGHGAAFSVSDSISYALRDLGKFLPRILIQCLIAAFSVVVVFAICKLYVVVLRRRAHRACKVLRSNVMCSDVEGGCGRPEISWLVNPMLCSWAVDAERLLRPCCVVLFIGLIGLQIAGIVV